MARGTNFVILAITYIVYTSLSGIYVDGIICKTNEGFKHYKIRDTVCCNGELHSRFKNGKEWECCPKRGQLYKIATQMCCGVQILDKFTSNGDERECLHEKISSVKELNCYGEVKDKPSEHHHCCGYEVYDSREKGCCEMLNSTTGTPNYNIYNSPLDLFNGERCCGSVKYNEKGDKVCIGNELLSKYIKQCNGTPYNVSERVCCDNKYSKPIPKDSSSSGQVYRCHNGQVYDENKEYFLPGDPDIHTVDQIIPLGHKPCGNTSYDNRSPRQYLCCANHLWNVSVGEKVECCGQSLIRYEEEEKCCSGQMFKETNKICCDGSLIDKYGTDKKCCGRLPYSENTHVCCHLSTSNTYTVVEKQKPDDTKCCKGNPYNEFKEAEVKKACGAEARERPSCNTNMLQLAKRACAEKKPEFRVKINRVTPLTYRLKIEATILKPKKYRHQNIVIYTKPDPCRQFKDNKVYRLFTNRRYKKNKTLRISDNDIVAQKTKKFNKQYRNICPLMRHINKHLALNG